MKSFMVATKECSNCHSRRRRVFRSGLCSRCFYWHRKRLQLQTELDSLLTAGDLLEAGMIRYHLDKASRILKEYAWRENNRNASDVHPWDVEAMIYAVAGECRSEIGFALHEMLAGQTPEARQCFYLVLLAIVENIPSRVPRLHSLTPPHKGEYYDAWKEWARHSG